MATSLGPSSSSSPPLSPADPGKSFRVSMGAGPIPSGRGQEGVSWVGVEAGARGFGPGAYPASRMSVPASPSVGGSARECIYHRFLSFSAKLGEEICTRACKSLLLWARKWACEVLLDCSHSGSSGNLSSQAPFPLPARTLCRWGGHGQPGRAPPAIGSPPPLVCAPCPPWALAFGQGGKAKEKTPDLARCHV